MPAWYTIRCESCRKTATKRNKGRRVPRFCSPACSQDHSRDPFASKANLRRRARRIPIVGMCARCGVRKATERHHPDLVRQPLVFLGVCHVCHHWFTWGTELDETAIYGDHVTEEILF